MPTRRATTRSAFPVLLALALFAGYGGSSSKSSTQIQGPRSSFHGALVNPPLPERPLILKDHLGRRVNLASYHGKAVLVTFIYTHCPDICPLIVGHLHTVQEQLGP